MLLQKGRSNQSNLSYIYPSFSPKNVIIPTIPIITAKI